MKWVDNDWNWHSVYFPQGTRGFLCICILNQSQKTSFSIFRNPNFMIFCNWKNHQSVQVSSVPGTKNGVRRKEIHRIFSEVQGSQKYMAMIHSESYMLMLHCWISLPWMSYITCWHIFGLCNIAVCVSFTTYLCRIFSELALRLVRTGCQVNQIKNIGENIGIFFSKYRNI